MLLLGLLGYVLLQFAIGVWISRRVATESDYILAGRSIGPVLMAFSVFATWFGAEALVATSAEVYTRGLSGALIDPFAYGSAIVIAALLLAATLWRRGLTTFADLFRERFSREIEVLVVLVLLPGSIFWAAAQIRAFGQVLSSVSELHLGTAIVIASVLIALYAFVGGLLADAVTDFVHGAVLIVGLIVLAAVVAAASGGVAPIMTEAGPERLDLFAVGEDGPLARLEGIVVAICGSLVAIELISRFLGARSASVARWGTASGGLLYIGVGFFPIFLGLAAAHIAAADQGFRESLGHSEQVVIALAVRYLPQWHYIAIAGALASAILSTTHAALHAPASQVSHNIVLKALPDLGARGRLLAVRLTVVVLSFVAFALAISSERIKDLVEIASAFGSAGVLVAALFGIFTRIGGPSSAWSSVVVGVSVWGAGRFLLDWTAPYITALICSTAAYLLVAMAQGHTRRS